MAGKKPARKASKKPSVRERKLVENVLRGDKPPTAARKAGYSESVARVDVYRILAKPSVRERIEARMRDAEVTTNEIIGTLVSQMRGDFADILPEDEFFKKCRENGVSHLIKEVETTKHVLAGEDEESCVTEVKRKIKIHDAQAAAKQLCNVFGLEKLPAPNPEAMKRLDEAVDRFIEKAAKKGIKVTPEQARAKLMPFIQAQGIQ
jgi:phage terminase small subunit